MGEWRLFIDSDTVLEKGALSAALNYCKKMNLGAISLVPRIETERLSAKIVAPALSSMIRLIYPLRAINNPESKSGLVVGGFLLLRASAYEKIGGHEAVRSELVEDKQIGSNLKSERIAFRLMTGRRLVTVALFTGGQSVWDSVKRTVTNPLRYQRSITTTFAACGFVLLTFPTFALAAALLAGSYSPIFLWSFMLSVLVPATVVTYDAFGMKNSSWSYALLAIIGGTVITLAILRQFLGRGRVGWRGRRY
jgi:cellulose synthase/poly-beta-1,6-N-acetylglucosamine synthase-like glycosyltransferase